MGPRAISLFTSPQHRRLDPLPRAISPSLYPPPPVSTLIPRGGAPHLPVYCSPPARVRATPIHFESPRSRPRLASSLPGGLGPLVYHCSPHIESLRPCLHPARDAIPIYSEGTSCPVTPLWLYPALCSPKSRSIPCPTVPSSPYPTSDRAIPINRKVYSLPCDAAMALSLAQLCRLYSILPATRPSRPMAKSTPCPLGRHDLAASPPLSAESLALFISLLLAVVLHIRSAPRTARPHGVSTPSPPPLGRPFVLEALPPFVYLEALRICKHRSIESSFLPGTPDIP